MCQNMIKAHLLKNQVLKSNASIFSIYNSFVCPSELAAKCTPQRPLIVWLAKGVDNIKVCIPVQRDKLSISCQNNSQAI